MNLEDIMLSERNQKQEAVQCMIPLTQSTWSCQILRDRKSRVLGEEGMGSECLRGMACQFGEKSSRGGWW